eukprot:TRINITY_DN10173_c0_g1_i3.p1 TRINITY_DN10173_c0_g1~~TRINITY_DN10173_c0_g1_i3.p1  ORF type:complete len:110 (+),score=6.66 TRINITY_DN10173_c0_g1_i3:49-330(+)
MADDKKPSIFEHMLVRQSPFGMLANLRARRSGLALPFAGSRPVLMDVGWPWRMDWGGHDPATPIAEMHINYHTTGWSVMLFVCTTVIYLTAKR